MDYLSEICRKLREKDEKVGPKREYLTQFFILALVLVTYCEALTVHIFNNLLKKCVNMVQISIYALNSTLLTSFQLILDQSEEFLWQGNLSNWQTLGD